MKRVASYLIILVMLLSMVLAATGCGKYKFIIATTTSLYDTGLWDELVPLFEDRYDVEVEILSAGTGTAIEYGQNGDVEVIAVHSKSQEEAFVADGYGVERVPFAYNYYLIVGPESDPAGIAGMTPENAFTTLIENPGSGKFVSRGDGSGTHSKEKAIWTSAGYDYDTEVAIDDNAWYIEGGAGMGATLQNADELEAYTLSDIGTFLTYKSDLSLVPVIESGSSLLNVYSVIACTKAKDSEMAENFVNFMVSTEIQQAIGDFGVADYGTALFTPCAGNEPGS